MRLKKVENDHTLKQRLIFGVMRVMLGMRAPDVVRVVKYRSELFGAPFSRVLQQALRGESEWSVGERELFAAFSARLQQCPF